MNSDGITFRKATVADSARAWEIILHAKALMASEGRTQWTEAYPAPSNIDSDIASEAAYVLCIDDVPMVYGAVIFTGEPAYEQLKGSWLSDRLPDSDKAYPECNYVVVHRLASAEEARGKGLAQRYFDEVSTLAVSKGIHSFKVDTNFDNNAMLHIMKKSGFAYCGEIIYPQGSRLAFEKLI